MLAWLCIALGILTAWVLVSWLDRRAAREMIAEFRGKWPDSCPICALERRMLEVGCHFKPFRHRCDFSAGEMVPAGRSEVVPVEP